MLHTTYYMLMLRATCYVLHATCYMLHTTCYMLHATCYMLQPYATCLRCMLMLHAYAACLCDMLMLHAYAACLCYMLMRMLMHMLMLLRPWPPCHPNLWTPLDNLTKLQTW